MPALVHDSMVVWADERGRIRFFDYGRPGDLGSRRQAWSPQDARLEQPLGVIEHHRPALFGRGFNRRPSLRQLAGDRILHAWHRDSEAQIDDLDRLVGRGVAITAIVLLVDANPGGFAAAG